MEIIPFRNLQEIPDGVLIHLMYMDMLLRPIKKDKWKPLNIMYG